MSASIFSSRARSQGFSMVELMVALVVGLFLIGAMFSVVLSSSSTGRTRERTSDMQNSGRYALDVMKRDIQHAGFNGYSSILNPDAPTTIGVTKACEPAFIGMLSRRISAGDDDNSAFTNCIPNGNYVAGTDILVVRHLSPTPVTAFESDVIYFRSAYEGGAAFLGSSPPISPDPKVWSTKKLWTDAFDYKLEESVYYISPCTNYVGDTCDKTENPRIPALYRMRLSKGPAMVPELVASGIENMQIRVKVTTTLNEATYAQPIATTDWAAVTAVEVNLLVRSSGAQPGYKNKDTVYVLGDQSVKAPDDSFPRRVFTTVVHLRN